MSLYNNIHSVHNDLRRGLHMLNGDVRSFVGSADFTKAMKDADENDETKAFLLVKALDGIALDPLIGSNVDSFVWHLDGEVIIQVRFDRMVNFLGLFSLPESSRWAAPVIAAVECNLRSRMFKAAAMRRRLDRRAVRLLESARSRARNAYAASLNRARASHGQGWQPSEDDLARANADYNQVFDPRKAQIGNRLHTLQAISAPEFSGSYTETVATFLYRHLPCH
ncbi:hypothetical protein [Ralstonia pseudosolanacearum]|uniref:hypothetical protein n=1 Tax=Ralstonia pseudosolanacearum TaxID=1310165 RepID=UPI003CF3B4DF